MFATQKSMLSLRSRLGDNTLGHAVNKGRFQLQRITYVGVKSTVVPLSGWISQEEFIKLCETYDGR